VAKLLGLDQPGGPSVELAAHGGDPARFDLPRPLLDRPGCDLSFSGLKTAVRRARDRLVESQGGIHNADRADLCAGFQAAVADTFAEKTRRACAAFGATHGRAAPVIAVAGGVAANAMLRARLQSVATEARFAFHAPPLALCTDNGAMIAWAAVERMALRGPDNLALSVHPRWPLDSGVAPMLGSGRRGAKA
jgi:N6-L-threonylcarbamoyladenine synthase